MDWVKGAVPATSLEIGLGCGFLVLFSFLILFMLRIVTTGKRKILTWHFITCNYHDTKRGRGSVSMPEVRVVNLTKKFGEITALDNINLSSA